MTTKYSFVEIGHEPLSRILSDANNFEGSLDDDYSTNWWGWNSGNETAIIMIWVAQAVLIIGLVIACGCASTAFMQHLGCGMIVIAGILWTVGIAIDSRANKGWLAVPVFVLVFALVFWVYTTISQFTTAQEKLDSIIAAADENQLPNKDRRGNGTEKEPLLQKNQKKYKNRTGANMHPGHNGNTLYCRREMFYIKSGADVFEKNDGLCGPHNGPQCRDCYGYTVENYQESLTGQPTGGATTKGKLAEDSDEEIHKDFNDHIKDLKSISEAAKREKVAPEGRN